MLLKARKHVAGSFFFWFPTLTGSIWCLLKVWSGHLQFLGLSALLTHALKTLVRSGLSKQTVQVFILLHITTGSIQYIMSKTIHMISYSYSRCADKSHTCITFPVLHGVPLNSLYIFAWLGGGSDLVSTLRWVICHSNKGDTISYFPGCHAFITASRLACLRQ